jgi:hypothetical protein
VFRDGGAADPRHLAVAGSGRARQGDDDVACLQPGDWLTTRLAISIRYVRLDNSNGCAVQR